MEVNYTMRKLMAILTISILATTFIGCSSDTVVTEIEMGYNKTKFSSQLNEDDTFKTITSNKTTGSYIWNSITSNLDGATTGKSRAFISTYTISEKNYIGIVIKNDISNKHSQELKIYYKIETLEDDLSSLPDKTLTFDASNSDNKISISTGGNTHKWTNGSITLKFSGDSSTIELDATLADITINETNLTTITDVMLAKVPY